MKTAENYINYTALRLINGIAGIPCEYGDQDESADHLRLMTIGEVRGVLDMAEAMKEVLKE